MSIAGGMPIGDNMHLVGGLDLFDSERIDNLDGRNWHNFTGLVTNNQPGPRLLTRPNVRPVSYTDGGVINAPGTSIDRLIFGPNGSTSPFINGEYATFSGTQNMVGGSGYNPAEFDTSVSTPAFPDGTRTGSFIPDSQRSSAFIHLDYEFSNTTTFYVEGMWGKNEANSVGTLPLGNSIWALTAYRDNPYLPPEIQAAMEAEDIESFRMQRYNTAADIAQDRLLLENESLSLTTGFRKEITEGFLDGWQVQGYWQSGRNDNNLEFRDFVRRDRLPMAMDAVIDPGTNNTVCHVTLFSNDFNDCVPVNLFGRGRASQAAIDWVNDDMWVLAELEQNTAELTADGIINEGWGAGAVSLAVGANWREQKIDHQIGPSALVNQPPLANNPAIGLRGMPIAFQGKDDLLQFVDLDNFQGEFDVKELFAETLVPLLADRTGIEQLNFSIAARWADYEGSGNIWAWKYGLDWEITPEVRVRGNVSRDVRAASLEERFDRQGQGTSVQDPELDQQVYTTFQIRGGNPEVSPEEADTLTLGVIYQPQWLAGFSASLDWYDIEVTDAIDFLGVQAIVDQCFATGSKEFCSRITRNPDTNGITLVENTFANVDKLNVNGMDLEMNWSTDVDWLGDASVNWRFLGSWLKENSTTEAGAAKRDLAGEVGGAGLPDYRLTTNVTYRQGPYSVFLQGRWIDSGINDIDYVEGIDIDNNTVDSVFYTDLRLAWNNNTANSGDWEVFLHVNNLFDEEPPLVPGWSNFSGTGLSTNESLYDVFGRRYTAGVRLSF